MAGFEFSGKAPDVSPSRHILLLDDEEAVRKALTRLLKSLGHQCTTAAVGEEVLSLLESSQYNDTYYDLAILDIKIFGGMGGIETLREMRESGCTIPVVSMSGYATEEIYPNEEDSKGFSGHLQKPFNARQLLSEIEGCCS
jgi:CheY-like chemotaxis protein